MITLGCRRGPSMKPLLGYLSPKPRRIQPAQTAQFSTVVDIPNLALVIGASDRLLHPPLIITANQRRLRKRGGDDNELIRSQNQGVPATLAIRRNPLCSLGFRLSLVRTVCGRFSSSRGLNADQTRPSVDRSLGSGLPSTGFVPRWVKRDGRPPDLEDTDVSMSSTRSG